jgi:hypothetical protein
MKRSVLVSTVCAALLLGCAYKQEPYPSRETRKLDPTQPQVDVVENRVIVYSPEPLVFRPEQKNVTITWQLRKDSPFRFAQDGIKIEGGEGEFVNCGPSPDGKEFSCVNLHTKRAKYRYYIKLLDSSGRALDPLDPSVVNM